jgi:hypothetical protein
MSLEQGFARIANNLSSGHVSGGIDTRYSVAYRYSFLGISRNTKTGPSNRTSRSNRRERRIRISACRCMSPESSSQAADRKKEKERERERKEETLSSLWN